MSNYDISNQLTPFPDFDIHSTAPVSREFTKRNISTFSEAAAFIRNLPYRRNSDKTNLVSIFSDHCGTCSSKHALLKVLADENCFIGFKLILGIFRMNETNTPEVSYNLRIHNLQYIPEAHCYLKFKDRIFDFTKQTSGAADFADELIEEIEIAPNQISDFKVTHHKNHLKRWLNKNPGIRLSAEEIWEIREQCIRALSGKE